MAMESKLGPMGLLMRAIGVKGILMDLVSFVGLMAKSIKESGKIV